MSDVLIRGLSEAALSRIDADAARLGLSRNEYLRRHFESDLAAIGRDALVAAVERNAGSMAGVFGPNALAELREDWPE